MRIFHIATTADWAAAQESGSYTTSTYGVSLAEEGFIHASRGDQWQGVRERFYADVAEPLVLLTIDPALLTAPVVEESPPGTSETFPHIYGPIDVAAVVGTIPLGEAPTHPQDGGPSFSRLFFAEMFHNVLLASLVMAVVVVGALGGRALYADWGAHIGTAAGLVVGVPIAVLIHRRR
ncbi:MAG: DUF952 domain-containing protein [Nocardioides sp.]